MITTATLGFPRIGSQRELKFALEQFWSGACNEHDFEHRVTSIRQARWLRQKHHGIAIVPSNDFSCYDHVLDTCCLVGAIPLRFGHSGGPVTRATYFQLARGGEGVAALEMTKWFDTNYHYLVPELSAATVFVAEPSKPVTEYREAAALGIATRPVLVGPLTFLRLSKRTDGGDVLDLLPGLIAAYVNVLRALTDAGATWVQIDEPALCYDLDDAWKNAYARAYRALVDSNSQLQLLLTTYFGAITDHLDTITALPVHGLHVDLVRAPEQLHTVQAAWPRDRVLSVGVVNGRNIWATDLSAALKLAQQAATTHPNLHIASSCSLMHVPVDVELETGLDPTVRSWMAFASQKLDEIELIGRGVRDGANIISAALTSCATRQQQRALSAITVVPAVRQRAARITPNDDQRLAPYTERAKKQQLRLQLPALPTTTIGSFPQTTAVRQARASFRAGRIDQQAYTTFLEQETSCCLRRQEELGLDVLVHGEFERTDMVEYFGELLTGFAFTKNGWVQSYGSRCVKPPIIVGDVHRPKPMTVAWARFAQAQTTKPVKGMLTGPVTILQWSFVRDDVSRKDVCTQIALALRDEVVDLEAAGIAIIQVDEPALREGLPLQQRDWPNYLTWAAACFRLATCAVRDDTQIHTHMCYSEFNDIISAIAALDADVISIETARSRMELLDTFERFQYPNDIGPGVYDIHSPAVPATEAMVTLLRRACRSLKPEQLWVNPDCGLKTRNWPEVDAALRNLVTATKIIRAELQTVTSSTITASAGEV